MHRISLSTASLHAKNPFHIAKTKPRKAISRSPFKLFDGSVSHELGPYNQPIDLRIGNQRMILDISQGCWKREETNENAPDLCNLAELKKKRHLLLKENQILHAKLNILLEMLAEVTAEEKLPNTIPQFK